MEALHQSAHTVSSLIASNLLSGVHRGRLAIPGFPPSVKRKQQTVHMAQVLKEQWPPTKMGRCEMLGVPCAGL